MTFHKSYTMFRVVLPLTCYQKRLLALLRSKTSLQFKDATGDLDRIAIHRELFVAKTLSYYGDDLTGLEFVKRGGDKVISVTNNVAAKDMANYATPKTSGKKVSLKKQKRSMSVWCLFTKTCFVEFNPIPVKWAVHKLGLIAEGGLRLPLTELSKPAQPVVARAMTEACIY